MIEMARYPSVALRIWRTAPWARNPLLRVSDRLEGAFRVFAVLMALAAIPVSAAIGTARYTDAVLEIRAENAAKVEVAATISDDPVRVPAAADGAHESRFEATAQWARDGRADHAQVEVSRTGKRGDTISVWLGPDGRPTTPPLADGAAAWRGIGLALGVLVDVWVVDLAVVWLVAWLLGRRRAGEWAREWREQGRPIGQDK
ncbi:hypothetical protein [Nocardia sp. BMG51109]|uniref:Rv1733c family protein n=1 Tax=Nocardia sp. BMG51109 TaxID=1056816 RepID=UPI0004631D10|nr:hypothetical protein [Nocardia sp. BMG51109]